MKNERMDWLEVEKLIEKRIEEDSRIYDMDDWDIRKLRLEVYKECGWSYDAGWDEDDDEVETEETSEYENSSPYKSLTMIYYELGLDINDHFCCR